MLLRNVFCYRLTSKDLNADQIRQALDKRRFIPAGAVEMERSGFVPPVPLSDALVLCVEDKMALIRLQIQKKIVPKSAIDHVVDAEALKIEQESGERVGRGQRREIADRVRDELLARAISSFSAQRAVFDFVGGLVYVEASSIGAADAMIGILCGLIDDLPLRKIWTDLPVCSALTSWLQNAPVGFSLEDACCLVNDSKARAQFSKINAGTDEIRAHVATGMSAAKLAMTWNDNISFVLNDRLQFSRLQLLDTAKVDVDPDAKHEDIASAMAHDVFVFSSMMKQLFKSVVAAMGGEAADLFDGKNDDQTTEQPDLVDQAEAA